MSKRMSSEVQFAIAMIVMTIGGLALPVSIVIHSLIK